MAEKEQQKDRGSDLGEMAVREGGKRAGQSVGTSLGSSGAASGGTAAGTAAGTAGGTAAGTGAGAAAGSAVAPVVGTAVGAGVGAIAGRYWKKILAAVIITPVLGCLGVMLFILAPVLIVVIVIMSLISGGGSAKAINPSGGAGGLKPTFCEQFKSGNCSNVLQSEITAAANQFGVPPAVLAGILAIEGPHVMTYDDQLVTKNSAAGAKDSEGIPFSSVSIPIATQIGCTVSFAGAVGPMQFTYAPAETLLGVSGASNTWADHAQPAQAAINDGRTVNPCNILDSLYAGSHKLKADSGTAVGVVNWEKADVYAAAAAYLGARVQADGCFPSYNVTFNYCDQVWTYYLNYTLAPVDDGSHTIPNGWPVSGVISTIYGEKVYLDGVLFEASHPGFDIASTTGTGQPTYSSMSGVVLFAGPTDNCGGVIFIYNSTSGYTLHLVHMSLNIRDTWKTADFVDAGKLVGNTYEGPLPGCSTGTHLHYEVRKDGTVVDPSPLVPKPDIQDGEAVSVGGGNWTPHN